MPTEPPTTTELAMFLASTGPPVQSPMLSAQSPPRHRQLFSRLRTSNRKRQAVPVTTTTKHIPLPVYHDPAVPSLVPPGSSLPTDPSPPRRQSNPEPSTKCPQPEEETKTTDMDASSQHQLYNSLVNIVKNPSLSSSLAHMAFPKPPATLPCPHCARLRVADNGLSTDASVPPSNKRKRRVSCPAAIKYIPQQRSALSQQNLSSQEAKALFELIEQLQSQLLQEEASRKALEQALLMAYPAAHTIPFPP